MIPNRSVYFGTKDRMAWIPAPAINIGRSKGRWQTSGVYLNGGAYVLNSDYSHYKYTLSWNLMNSDRVREIQNYADGIYGRGLIYFLDPFAKNVLPLNWSAPFLTAGDAPPLVYEQDPSTFSTPPSPEGSPLIVPQITLVPSSSLTPGDGTPAGPQDLPFESAKYTLTSSSVPVELFVPVPPGEAFNFGAIGAATGTARVTLTSMSGVTTTPALMDTTSTSVTNTVIYDHGGGVTVALAGTGDISLSAMTARIGEFTPTNRFTVGEGNSGLKFVDTPNVTGYSAPSAMDLQAIGATLVEVGAWEPR